MTPSLTLSTYTFNDAALVDDLLAAVATWSRRPDEIIVTDDGSDVPYVPPPGVRLIRLPTNRGITEAKRTGISSATSDLVLSVDCDARLSPTWLDVVTPHALRPEVGLASGSTAHQLGDDAVSQYLARFGDNHNQTARGPVEFIPGNAFLLRREVWERVGGFGDHERRVLEDHVLCSRIRRSGFQLYADCDATCIQIRKLSRITMCKRIWSWLEPAARQRLPPDDQVVRFALEVFIAPLIERIHVSLAADDLRLVYLDLVHVYFELCELLAFRASTDEASPLYDELRGELAARLAPHAAAGALLRGDLARLGHPLTVPPARHERWSEVFLILDVLDEAGFFAWMESEGVRAITRDDDRPTDFSSYA